MGFTLALLSLCREQAESLLYLPHLQSLIEPPVQESLFEYAEGGQSCSGTQGTL